MLDRMEHGVMFGFVGDDMTAAVYSAAGKTEHGQIARFCSAACENDFVRLGVNEGRDFVARVVDRGARVATSPVDTGWITEMLTEIRQHRFAGWIAKRSSRVVIEINHSLNSSWLLVGFFFRLGTMRSCFSS